MAKALNQTGREITFYMSCGGGGRKQPWANDVANIWRIGNDHLDCWTDGPCPRNVGYRSNGHGTVQAIGYFRGASAFAGPGGWNTGDFLKTGGESCDLLAKPGDLCPKQTLEEYRTEFTVRVLRSTTSGSSKLAAPPPLLLPVDAAAAAAATQLWSMASSPLLVSTDIRNLTAIQREILLQREVIAVDQQPVAGDEIGQVLQLAGLPADLHDAAIVQAIDDSAKATAQSVDPGWFIAANAQACSFPTCCSDSACPTGHKSAFTLIALGTNVQNAEACQQLCQAHHECAIWQLGSQSKGGHCTMVNATVWQPVAMSGGRSAGCKLGISGCGKSPIPPRPAPAPHHRGGTTEVWVKPLMETAYPATSGWSALEDHHAIALLNVGEESAEISAHLPTTVFLATTLYAESGAQISAETLQSSRGNLRQNTLFVRDVWDNKTLPHGAVSKSGLLTVRVAPHGVKLFRVWATSNGVSRKDE
jgi:hypothetical protein